MSEEKAKTGTSQPVNDEMVLTPGGWRPKSTIHRVEAGHHISAKGGRLRKIHTASGKVVADYGKVSAGHSVNPRRSGAKMKTPAGSEPYPDNGWIIDSESLSSKLAV